MFGRYIRWSSLAVVCDALAKTLGAGVDVRRAFQLAADKTRDERCRRAMRGVVDGIRRGENVSAAMDRQDAFPPLMLDLVSVAEDTGMLPEIFEHLRDHYESNLRLRRSFVGQIAWPVLEFVMAVAVVAGLILVLGIVADSQGSEPLDPFGLGLSGVSGALTWLAYVFGTLFALFVAYQLATRLLAGRAAVHRALLNVPVVGHCLRSFALARFSWAFYLTQQTGMPMRDSLRASLRATDNGAFQAVAPRVVAQVEGGDDLTTALATTGVFPRDYLEMVRVGEESGTVPEALHRLSPGLEETARRSLAALAATFGWLVWGTVLTFIAIFVFRFAAWYVGLLNDALQNV